MIPHITINTIKQQLLLYRADDKVLTYPISTAKKGLGERKNSEQTPRGQHIIRACIGKNQPIYSVFRGRRPTGEIYTTQLGQAQPQRDWILSRILWLSGTEIGKNRLGNVDSMQRFIYIHGTPDEYFTAIPSSHGCVRMQNQDIVELFDQVYPGMTVLIN